MTGSPWDEAVEDGVDSNESDLRNNGPGRRGRVEDELDAYDDIIVVVLVLLL